MKLVVLSDIHANLPALQAVIEDIDRWHPDIVIMAGDVVNRGPRPRECLELIQQKAQGSGWLTVRGNHEEYVIHVGRPEFPRVGAPEEVHRPSIWTFHQLGGDVSALQAMPLQQSLETHDGSPIRITHASMRGMRDGIYPETGDDELRTQIGPPPALFVVGHTHRPLVRRLDSTLVVNAGSAGLPFDSDYRPSYARLWQRNGGWQGEIARVDYDRAQAERDYYTTGYLENGGPLTQLVLTELQTASSLLYYWAVRFQDKALAGEVSMNETVAAVLAERTGKVPLIGS